MAFPIATILPWSYTVVSAVSMHFVASAHKAYFYSPTLLFSLLKCSHIYSHPNTSFLSKASCLWWLCVKASSTICIRWLNFSSAAPKWASISALSRPWLNMAVLWIENSMFSMFTVDGMAAISSCRLGYESAWSCVFVASSISWLWFTDWEWSSTMWACVGGNGSDIWPSSISVSLFYIT